MSVAKTVTLTTLIPSGLPGPEHFSTVESTAPTADDLEEGGFLLKVFAMSADPYLRGGCKTGEVPRPMAGFVAGKVMASKSDKWAEGDLLGASLPFTDLQIVSAEAGAKTVMWKLNDHVTEATISHGVGVLGMPGSTAYGGFLDVLRPKAGAAEAGSPETIWVSGAAGAVGSMVAQIAKNVHGCKVVGSCGGPAKVALCKEKFGMDEAIDYKLCPDVTTLKAALKEAAPDGLDVSDGQRC